MLYRESDVSLGSAWKNELYWFQGGKRKGGGGGGGASGGAPPSLGVQHAGDKWMSEWEKKHPEIKSNMDCCGLDLWPRGIPENLEVINWCSWNEASAGFPATIGLPRVCRRTTQTALVNRTHRRRWEAVTDRPPWTPWLGEAAVKGLTVYRGLRPGAGPLHRSAVVLLGIFFAPVLLRDGA